MLCTCMQKLKINASTFYMIILNKKMYQIWYMFCQKIKDEIGGAFVKLELEWAGIRIGWNENDELKS